MKIVIDIPDKVYSYINRECKELDDGYDSIINHLIHGVLYGTVLPKEHERLIDADDLIQEIIDDSQLCIFNSECERIVHDKMVDFAVDRITETSSIVEADKGENDL